MTEVKRFPGQPVLILGLSRCGTSYLASFLRANGVDLGANLGQSGYVNPRGFFEERTFVNFHRRLLAKNDPRGADIPILAGSIAQRLSDAEEAEGAQILKSLARPGVWGWKDPRTLLFIDFWLRLLPDAKLIIPIRHPLENYCSYLKRIREAAVLKPSVFFSAYARQSERLLEVAKRCAPHVYVLDAPAAYRQPELLRKELTAFLGLDDRVPPSCPAFHEKEFTRIPLSKRACDVFMKNFPEACTAFLELNEMATIRFQPVDGSSRLDPMWSALGAAFSMFGHASR
ncbi:MAG: sulfotransferase [Bryobacteraceae bacterium]